MRKNFLEFRNESKWTEILDLFLERTDFESKNL